MITWKDILEETILNCIRSDDFVENYDKEDDKNFFMLTENAQRYLYEVRKRYLALSEVVNCMDAEDFVDDEEDNLSDTLTPENTTTEKLKDFESSEGKSYSNEDTESERRGGPPDKVFHYNEGYCL